MSRHRPEAAPPSIAGFEYVRRIGQGGFADVFLYHQASPNRDVAVKVLIADEMGSEAVARLNAEADAMAGLSQHQNIVTVFSSGVAADGRPYMVMEYYRRPSLAAGLRKSPLSLESALSVGVQLAGAVESAHRRGIKHRDIKPANILVDQAGRPVLGDFGIAMTIAQANQEAEGFSVPWSPPEAFQGQALWQSDVWSLAATVYTLLTGRTPFQIPGGDNRTHALMDRIRTAPYCPLGRADAPSSLDQVLATSMSKAPGSRYPTMRAFGMALRGVEQELRLPPTLMDILEEYEELDESPDEEPPDDGPGTRLRPVTIINPTGPSTAGNGPLASWPSSGSDPTGTSGWSPASVPGQALAADPGTVLRPANPPEPGSGWGAVGELPIAHTQLRYQQSIGEPPADSVAIPAEPRVRRNGKLLAGLIGLGLLLGVLAAVVVVNLGGRLSPTLAPSSSVASPQDPLGPVAPKAPRQLVGVVDGKTASFRWLNPDPQPGDSYRWIQISEQFGDAEGDARLATETSVEVPIPEGRSTVCVEVTIVRSGMGSEPAKACAGAAPGQPTQRGAE